MTDRTGVCFLRRSSLRAFLLRPLDSVEESCRWFWNLPQPFGPQLVIRAGSFLPGAHMALGQVDWVVGGAVTAGNTAEPWAGSDPTSSRATLPTRHF